MFRTIYWYLQFVVSLTLNTVTFYRLKKMKHTISEEDYQLRLSSAISRWAHAQIAAAGATYTVTGMENIPADEAVLFICNHQGNFDIALLLALIVKPKGFISKKEILSIPILRAWMKEIRCLFIDRSDVRQSAKIIFAGIDLLKSGHSMLVFPEGTRSRSAQIGKFKKGAFKLATRSKVKIVPITINGSYKIMEANHSFIRPAAVKIVVHPPVVTAALTKEELAALPETVKTIIQNAM